MVYRKKLIEVALPLDAINAESAREKSIRHGHPSTLHLWWARRPLATCRAVLFASLVDDPAEPEAPPAYLDALDALPKPEPLPLLWDGMTVAEQRRERLFSFITRLVKWENSNAERIIGTARELINLACEGKPPPVLDPFCGGGSIPLEAQRLGLEAHASDLNPVAVLITKALIEIPPKFAGRPPVNPEDRAKLGGALRQAQGERGWWKGAAGLAADVRYYGKWMRDEAERRIGHLYPKAKLPASPSPSSSSPSSPLEGEEGRGDEGKGPSEAAHPDREATVIAWLWARTVKCPNPACGAQMPLVRSFALSTKPGKQVWVEPEIDRSVKTPVVSFRVKTGIGGVPKGTVNRKGAACVVCGASVPFDHVRSEGKAGRMSVQLMAIVAEGRQSRTYLSPDDAQVSLAESAKPDSRPEAPLPHNPRDFKTPNYGIRTFADLFTPRQLVALTTFSDLVSEARERAQRDSVAAGLRDDGVPLAEGGIGARAYGEAVATYLALAVDKGANLWSSIASWMNDRGAFRETFTRQAIQMTWDFAEANPFTEVGGSVELVLVRCAEVVEHLGHGRAGAANQLDAANGAYAVQQPLVSTDPPYYDNIGYADLSDFFYVWLRHSLRTTYPELFTTLLVPKAAELVATPYRFGGSTQRAQDFFRQGLGRAFVHMRSAQSPDFPLTIYYAFKQSETDGHGGEERNGGTAAASTGWEAMIEGLIEAKIQVTGTWPVRTEGSGRINQLGTNALASSIVLVCRPRPENAPAASRAEFLEELGMAMRSALPILASGQVAPVDLAQASIGPGMAVYSRYSGVVRQDGRRVTVREALQDINNAIAAYRSERVSSFDPETRFCLAWYEQYGYAEGVFGDADNLARAYNVGPEAMQRDGLLVAAGGRVRLEQPASYPVGVGGLADRSFGGSAWEACLRLAITMDKEGESGAALLARELGEGAAARARELAVWLYTIADAKKRSEDAYLFNALDASWAGIQEEIARQSSGQQASF